MVRYSLVVFLGLCSAGPVAAASWADALFDEFSRDFGSVPRGPVLSHSFRVVNKSKQPVAIQGARATCGCVTAAPLRHNLKPGEETTIFVQMDTRRFNGAKMVTVYVQFSQPSWEEVRLWVQANSREDVTVTPDALDFGRVKREATPTVAATVTFLSSADARLVEARCDSNYVETAIRELRRQDGEVSYQLTARLRSDTPVGKWYADIWLKTNQAALPRIRVPLTVEVESLLSVSPSSVALGQVKMGGVAERKVIVRAAQPFRITSIAGTDAELSARDSTTENKPVHVLTVTFRPKRAGDLERTLRIVTDLKEEGEIELQTRAQVVP